MSKLPKLLILSGTVLFLPLLASAAILSMEPAAGTFVTGSTFSVSIFLNTENELVNAVKTELSFPPDKLQVISPSTGISIIGNWLRQPSVDNSNGRIFFEGVIPAGIYAEKGLVATVNFRIRGVGRAPLKFLDTSSVFLADGKATDVLKNVSNGIYELVLPPPSGPLVVSETHPDQSVWYSNPNVILRWGRQNGIDGYSYVLNHDPVDVPDDVSEGISEDVFYKNLADGQYYFHVKVLRNGIWGGITNFSINIDTTPPADFKINILPYSRTVRRQPLINFESSDALSGIGHYELKLVALNPEPGRKEGKGQLLFIEAQSPYLPSPLELGDYDVIVRAFDKAGNFKDIVERLKIRQAVLEFIGDEGIMMRSRLVISWFWLWIFGAILLLILFWLAVFLRRRHRSESLRLEKIELPVHVKSQLDELKKYRKKYGRALIILLLFSTALFGNVLRSEAATLAPPLITTVSRDISNEEIFYIGGKLDVANASVIIYLQNLQDGQVLSETTASDKRGDWFYRHPSFLPVGNYLLWVQTRLGEEASPPSPQVQLAVRPTAIQFGASRLSYETLYLIFTVFLLILVIGLGWYAAFHAIQVKRKRAKLLKEVREAEESVRRGFAVLQRDIQAELAVIKKAKLSKQISAEEKVKEETLLRDLAWVEKYVGKEVWDIERVE